MVISAQKILCTSVIKNNTFVFKYILFYFPPGQVDKDEEQGKRKIDFHKKKEIFSILQ